MNAMRDAHRSSSSGRGFSRPRTGRTIALVDARFIEWLGAPKEGASPLRRERLPALLEAVLEQAGLPPDLARVYWFDGDAGAGKFNGQVLRPVLPESADGGASLALAMARELATLAENAACDHVLMATDDDRLLVAMDAAQQRGLRVHLLADETAQELESLAKSDAAWATLLHQADTRIIVAGSEVERALWGDGEIVLAPRPPVAQPRRSYEATDSEPGPRFRRELQGSAGAMADRSRMHTGADERGGPQEGYEGPHPRDERMDRGRREGRAGPPSAQELNDMRAALRPLLADWWDGLPVEDREEFAESLPAQRGLPQEVDRQLLLRLSQRLGRPLSFPEKKLMRELAREVCGPSDEAQRPASNAEAPVQAAAT